MALAAGAANLFFNRDTKVFAGQSVGRPITNASVTAGELTTSYAHGLSTGDRVVITAVGAATGVTLGTVAYVNVSGGATKIKLYTTLALAIAGGGVDITPAGTVTGLYLSAVDLYHNPTTVTPGSDVIVVASSTAMFIVGDVVQMSNLQVADLSYAGVYYVSAATPGTSFTLKATGATATGALTSPTSIEFRKMMLWELPVTSGYSMSQGVSTSEITINEMSNSAGASRRGRQMFNDAMTPSEWSLDTYVRPYKSTNHYAVEEVLWASLLGKNVGVITYSAAPTTDAIAATAVSTFAQGVTRSANLLTLDTDDTNTIELAELDLFFVFGANKFTTREYSIGSGSASVPGAGDTVIYKIGRACINEASMSFDIDGLATVSWSGMGRAATELGYFYGTAAQSTGVSSTSNFIRNRLTTLTAVSTASTGSITYSITLTGGSISINNNINYITPEILGQVNRPFAAVAGTRTIGGTFTAYMDETTNSSIDLFQNLAERYNSVVQNSHALNFYVGGFTGTNVVTAPGIQFTFAQAHLEVPSLSTDDIISAEVNFHALPSTVGGTDEMAIRFIGQTL